jgi:hypothetical protein
MDTLVRERLARAFEVSQDRFVRERFWRAEKIWRDTPKCDRRLSSQAIIRSERLTMNFQ